MTEASDAFERMVTRIHDLIDDEGSDVKWNEKIPDPDNPDQLRQIDVVIRRDEFLHVIECRRRKEVQDVNWIEELMGRRTSLEADCISAVSSSGFTKGAVMKAAKYGIPLFDVISLTDQQIKSWSRSISISLFFYRYENYRLTLRFDARDIEGIEPDALVEDLANYPELRTIFSPANEQLDAKKLMVLANRSKRVKFWVRFKIEDFELQGRQVVEVETSGTGFLEEQKLSIPETLAYGTPDYTAQDRSVFVQEFNLGQTKIVHSEGRIFVTLDISALEIQPFWQFRFCNITGEDDNEMEGIELIGAENLIMKISGLPLTIESYIQQT